MTENNAEFELKKAHRLALRQQIARQNEVLQDLIQLAKEFLENEAYTDAESLLKIIKSLDVVVGGTEEVATQIDKELL